MKNNITFILCLLFSTTISAQSGDPLADLMSGEPTNIVAFASSKKTPTVVKATTTKDETDAKKLDYLTKIERTFSLYPNPAHHWVVINTADLGLGEFSYTIKDSVGKVIEIKTMTKASKTIHLKEFAKGVYFITLSEKGGQLEWVQKVTVI